MPMGFDLRKYINPCFIETGTYKGDGVNCALMVGFKKIHSIELGGVLYKEAAARFHKEIKSGRVNLYLGDSTKLLPDILAKVDAQATFWLDAHLSTGGENTVRGDEDVPLLKELDLIGKHKIKTHTILIDDVRLFATKGPEDWSGVTLNKVIDKLKSINRNYSIHYENGLKENDVLVAEIREFNLGKCLYWFNQLTLARVGRLIKRLA